MAVNKLTELVAVMNEAQREGKVLGFDTVSGDIRSYDPDYIGGGGGSAGGDVTAENTTITKSLEEWMATGLVVRDIETLKQIPGFESNQIVHVLGYYSDTRGIGGGTFLWNGGSTYPEDDGTVFAVEGETAGRWNRILDDPMVVRSEDFGLFNGRETQEGVSEVIDAMRRVVPDGGTIRFYPTENPIRTEKVRVDARSFNIDLGGNVFVGVNNVQVFEIVGEVTNVSPVDFLDRVSYNTLGYENTSVRNVTQVTFPTASDYSEGDVVKIVSSDELPDLFNPNRRLGQFATVAAVNDNSITLHQELFDHDLFQTEVMIGKVADHTVSIYNGSFAPDELADPTIEWGPSRIYMEMLKYPRVENVKGVNLDRRLMSLYSCYQFVVEDCHVVNSANYPVGEGYVLNDVGGYGGFARNISSDHCRHVVTTNSRASTTTGDFNVGRGLHLTVMGGVGKFSYNHAFDTHPEAAYTTFIGCKAYQCDGAFQSRSPYTTFESCEAHECYAPFMFGTARENYANSFRYNSVRNCKVVNTSGEVTTFGPFIWVTGDSLTANDYGPIYVSGCDVEYVNDTNTGNALLDGSLGNLEIHFNNNNFVFADSASQRMFKIETEPHSLLHLHGNKFTSKVATAADFRLVQFTGTWPTGTETPMVYCTNNVWVGPAALDALVASADAFLAGNTIENVTDGFSARKFDGVLVTAGYTD